MAAEPLRIVFMGADAIALPLLEWTRGPGRGVAQVVGLFTQPDRPVGRGQQIRPNAIKEWALAGDLPVFQPERITEAERLALAALQPDVALVMAYGHILRDDLIGTPRLGTLNLHTSLLPAYRGASPIQTAIAAGEPRTAVSLMRIVRRLDAGPVADVETVAIGARDTAQEIESRLAAACVPLLARALPRLAAGTLEFVAQDETVATYCRKLERTDGVLDFSVPARVLAARINGLNPWPGVSLELDQERIKVGLAEAGSTATSAKPGTVVPSDGASLAVATGEGVVHLLRLQRPGGRMLPAAEFLRGRPVAVGTVLSSAPMPELIVRR
jgi:methionyl-tRNA formyltransferase